MRDLDDLPPLASEGPAKPGYDYMVSRGIPVKQLDKMIDQFDLRYEAKEQRVAFPVRADGKAFGYTARSIHPYVRKRWLDHPEEGVHRDVVYEANRVKAGGDTLFVVEGPFDAVMITAAMKDGNRSVATAFFGSLPTDKQLTMIEDAVKQYRFVYMALDGDVAGRCRNLAKLLDVGAIDIGMEFNDPGGMPFDELQQFVEYASTSSAELITWLWDRRHVV